MQTLSDHILDIAQNSIRAQASRVEIKLQENITKDSLVITIRDNGYTFDTNEVKEILEGVPLNDPEIVIALRQMIRENIKEITQTS